MLEEFSILTTQNWRPCSRFGVEKAQSSAIPMVWQEEESCRGE